MRQRTRIEMVIISATLVAGFECADPAHGFRRRSHAEPTLRAVLTTAEIQLRGLSSWTSKRIAGSSGGELIEFRNVAYTVCWTENAPLHVMNCSINIRLASQF